MTELEHILRLKADYVRREESSSFLKHLMPVARIKEKDKVDFCVQLAVLLEAGVSLHRSLKVLEEQADNDRMTAVINRLSKEIQKGNSFAAALSRQPDVFDTLFVVTAEVGQESGKLPEVLSQLGTYLEKINGLKRKFRQALSYPALVMLVAAFAVTFLLVFIVPAFGEMFKSFQMELPLSTQIVLTLSGVVTTYGPYFAVGLLLLIIAAKANLRGAELFQRVEPTLLKIPVLGDMLLKNHVARFCRTLGTLLKAQVSLVDALQVTQRIFTNENIRKEIGAIQKSVKQGRAIAEPLVKSTFFPPMVAQMIAVGEETSELDRMLLKVAEYSEKELDGRVEVLSSVIEPVIILFLGLLVALILVSMYMPMFDLVNVVGNG